MLYSLINYFKLRACLNFIRKVFYSASSEFVFGLFLRFSSSHSPLCSLSQHRKILKNNSQHKQE
ncbi:hypothetical protein DWX01_18055 [Bacteroides eggerthii]|uniref:Uncharacterized protein n=1 Tax=Phocaeicola vulgatus TaxID=821 RepID=A0A412Q8Y7_PHOVU|nr:hypothetical protein DWX04_20725 [Phocaeicola vulgatus]RGT95298.1 hypothetical protein DWX01_18055 [Bacteroides eggerthii]RGU57033.1 hypothetical protein DWW55_19325 [Paraprevotella clara]RJV52193.1 hypothetical protein DWX15_12170 [Bacteroides sp. AF18-33]